MEYVAACKIQAVGHAYCVKAWYVEYLAACKVQLQWRCYCVREWYSEYCAAWTIQSFWHGLSCRMEVTMDTVVSAAYSLGVEPAESACFIQTFYCGSCIRAKTCMYVGANKIQTFWHGYLIQ